MPNLFPTFDAPSLVEQSSEEPAPKYGRSWLFDFSRGDFVLDGSGRVTTTDGHSAWAHWCVKSILTERFARLAYGPGYGIEREHVLRQSGRPAVEAEVERAITEALLSDPRTQAVREFTFAWQGDQLLVSFVAVPVIGASERLEVKLVGGAA